MLTWSRSDAAGRLYKGVGLFAATIDVGLTKGELACNKVSTARTTRGGCDKSGNSERARAQSSNSGVKATLACLSGFRMTCDGVFDNKDELSGANWPNEANWWVLD